MTCSHLSCLSPAITKLCSPHTPRLLQPWQMLRRRRRSWTAAGCAGGAVWRRRAAGLLAPWALSDALKRILLRKGGTASEH